MIALILQVVLYKLTLLTAQQANESERLVIEARNMILFGKLVDQEDGRLMSHNSHFEGVWMPGSFIGQ